MHKLGSVRNHKNQGYVNKEDTNTKFTSFRAKKYILDKR